MEKFLGWLFNWPYACKVSSSKWAVRKHRDFWDDVWYDDSDGQFWHDVYRVYPDKESVVTMARELRTKHY